MPLKEELRNLVSVWMIMLTLPYVLIEEFYTKRKKERLTIQGKINLCHSGLHQNFRQRRI